MRFVPRGRVRPPPTKRTPPGRGQAIITLVGAAGPGPPVLSPRGGEEQTHSCCHSAHKVRIKS